MRDGWYVTGDIAMIDEDGFIRITDRLSRFSKIGGEMVPHMKIEDAINAILGDACSAVTAVPDAATASGSSRSTRGPDVTPRVAVGAALPDRAAAALAAQAREPRFSSTRFPTLGTGKVDLRRLRQLALERSTAN